MVWCLNNAVDVRSVTRAPPRRPSCATKKAATDREEVLAAVAAQGFVEPRVRWLWANGRKERTLVARYRPPSTREESTVAQEEEEDDDDDWWRLTHGCGVGSPPLAVLLTTADRMADFRTGGYEDNLVKGSSWSVGALLAPLQDHQLAAVTSAGAEAGEAWEERCSALEASGDLNAEFSGNGGPAREEALRALRALHKVLSDVGVSPLDLQRAAALT